MKFGHLILRKIIRIVATRYQILRQMHQIRFQLGLCPGPRWGSLQCSPDPLVGFKGPTSKGREGQGNGEERKREGGMGKGRGGRKGEGEGKGKERGGEGPPTAFWTN